MKQTNVQDRSLTLLNGLGDVTITWSSDKDEEVKRFIQQKISKGISFFLIKKVPLLPFYREKEVKDARSIEDMRVQMKDDELAKLLMADGVKMHRLSENTLEFVKITKDVEIIAKNHVVAMPMLAGG